MAPLLWRNGIARPALAAYLTESSRPLASLVFILPMIVLYEAAVWALGPEAMRNGAEVWLREGLRLVGLGQSLLLPLFACGVLLAWHHLAGDPWRLSSWTMPAMALESALLALLLVGLVNLQAALFRSPPPPVAAALWQTPVAAGQLLGYFGAGIYEELLFRLLLLTSAAGLIQSLGASRKSSVVTAAVATSLLFAAAHYKFITPYGETFDAFTFTFRFAAGLFFASLFVWRGFGVAAGSHALYDIFVVTL